MSQAPNPEEEEAFYQLLRPLSGLEMEAYYCSALDRCWIARTNTDNPIEAIDSCNAFVPGDL